MKTDKNYKQKGMRVGGAGGFFNQLMSNNDSVPVVGEGATELMYSDRHAFEVLEVDEKKKTCVIDQYKVKRTDKLGMSDSQDYEYKELAGNPTTLYWKWGAWRVKGKSFVFTDEAREKYGEFGQALHDAYEAGGGEYQGAFISSEVEGITKKKTDWYKKRIIFGVKREYYDFSF